MNPETFEQALEQLAADGLEAKQRRLVVFAGDRGWCRQQAELAIDVLQPQCGVWLGELSHYRIDSLAMSQARHWLGRETDLVVIDSHKGMDPDAIAAISGTLKSGGLLVWLVPPLDNLSHWSDPELNRLQSHDVAEIEYSPFLERLAQCFRNDASIYFVEQGQALKSLPVIQSSVAAPSAVASPYISEDQQRAVVAVMKVVSGHRRRPLVLTADRGRGKSAAFGIAAAQLLQQGKQHIRVVAPAWSSVETLFRHAQQLLPGSQLSGQSLRKDAAVLEFVAPDAVDYSPVDLLLIDEAAALPVSMLETLLHQYSRIAFATTVHGYEGTGRGFALRFRKTLDTQTPGWHEIKMQQPVRWSQGDPLEAFIFRAFLLDAEPLDVSLLDEDAIAACQFSVLSREELNRDERLLQQVFGLLVQAHYRTRPYDLRFLLDAPNVHLYIARYRQQVLAVCLVVEEGGLDVTLAEPVFRGERWLKGHLLPQLMQLQLHTPLLILRGARIMRIAVHGERQGSGLGTRMVNFVERDCRDKQLDWLGVSFGAHPELFDFWSKHALKPVSIATHPESRSGEYSFAMIKGFNDEIQAQLESVSQRAAQRFWDGLPGIWNTLATELVERLIVQWRGLSDEFSDEDRLEVQAFASGKRRFEDSVLALRQWVSSELAGEGWHSLSTEERQLLVKKLLQDHDWECCAQGLGLSGTRPVVDRIRKTVMQLLK